MVSEGRSVRSYVCADLLSTREGSPSKVNPPLTRKQTKNQTTTNATAISSTKLVVSLHAKSILWIAHAARSDVSKCLLEAFSFRISPLHCATRLVSRVHIVQGTRFQST